MVLHAISGINLLKNVNTCKWWQWKNVEKNKDITRK